MTARAPRTAGRTAAALLLVAAIGLGGCEQLKAIGAMVGLGGDEAQTAPSPPPRRPRPAAAAASPAPGQPGASVPPRATTAASPAPAAAASQAAKADSPAGVQAPGRGASAGRTTTPGAHAAAVSTPGPATTAGQPAPLGATTTARPAPPVVASASPSPATAAVGRPASPGDSASSVPKAAEPAASPQVVGLPVRGEPFDPTGKRDPFRPYVTSAELAEKRSKERLSPLQQLELSQLKLVAIVWGMRRNHAMVEDPAGVGYVLRVGTKVGPNGGRVARIAPDAVYVEESFRDANGSVLTNRITLRLPEKNRGGKGS